jgi:hypothetical protein
MRTGTYTFLFVYCKYILHKAFSMPTLTLQKSRVLQIQGVKW